MSNTLIGGHTTVTLPKATVTALTSGGVSVTTFGSATAAFDKAGDLVADFGVTGGYVSATDVILHQGSGLTFSDTHGSITISDFRIDTQTDIVYGDVSETVGKTTTTLSNVDIFNIGSGLSLTLTSDAVHAVNGALNTALTTSTPIGTAAPSAIANPLSVALEENPLFRALFGGCNSGPGPIVAGETTVTFAKSALATLGAAKVAITALGSAALNGAAATFGITGGSATTAGDVILHQGSGLEFSDAKGNVEVQNLLVDTIHHEVDAYVSVNGKFVADLAVFSIGNQGALTLTSTAAGALDSALGLGTALVGAGAIANANPQPFALSAHEAALLSHFH